MGLSTSKIDYLTHVCNVAVGCYGPGGTAEQPRRCPHCWCGPLLKRIGAKIGCELCVRNVPHVHPERLVVPGGKPKVIGVGFMTDLWGNPAGQWKVDTRDHGALWLSGCTPSDLLRAHIMRRAEHTFVTPTQCPGGIPDNLDPPDNWWLLVTCTTQRELNERLPAALVRWQPERVVLNLEPLLGPIDCQWEIERGLLAGVILGGMSAQPGAPPPVPMHPDWVRSVRDQCAPAGVPFYFKQWSDANPGEFLYPAPMLDGRTHRGLPWQRKNVDTDQTG